MWFAFSLVGQDIAVGIPGGDLAPRVIIVGLRQGEVLTVALPVDRRHVALEALCKVIGVGKHRIRCALDFQPVKAVQLFIVGYFLSDLPLQYPEHN